LRPFYRELKIQKQALLNTAGFWFGIGVLVTILAAAIFTRGLESTNFQGEQEVEKSYASPDGQYTAVVWTRYVGVLHKTLDQFVSIHRKNQPFALAEHSNTRGHEPCVFYWELPTNGSLHVRWISNAVLEISYCYSNNTFISQSAQNDDGKVKVQYCDNCIERCRP
jgi:hypothetical protein